MTTTGTKKRTYDEQFKRDAVALLEVGRKATELARELGISPWNLRDWKERYGTGAAAVKIASLRRELDSIRAQNDILKKALAKVAQQEASATPSSKSSTTSSRA
jgi:transposase